VSAERDGRIVRYKIADPAIKDLLSHAVAPTRN
jgi:hypothetical protein